jgi:hypothetical protein
MKKIGQEKGMWEAVILPGVQDVEACLLARYAESRCSGTRGIDPRSLCHGQRDSDADDLDILVHKRGRKYVREVRVAEKEEEVQKRDQEEVEAYQKSAVLSVNSGSAAASGSSSLAAIS